MDTITVHYNTPPLLTREWDYEKELPLGMALQEAQRINYMEVDAYFPNHILIYDMDKDEPLCFVPLADVSELGFMDAHWLIRGVAEQHCDPMTVWSAFHAGQMVASSEL